MEQLCNRLLLIYRDCRALLQNSLIHGTGKCILLQLIKTDNTAQTAMEGTFCDNQIPVSYPLLPYPLTLVIQM